MNSKEFLDYVKKIPEEQAIKIIDNMNFEADRMANIINNENNLDKNWITKITIGRIKECEHFLELTEKLSWLKESEEHNLFVSMIKMRIEFLKQDDDIKKIMIDILKEL